MKRFLSICTAVCLIFIGCSKDELDNTEQELEVLNASVGVYNETQLRNAISSASPGDVITVNGTIYLTQQLQLLRNGQSSAKINFTGGTLDCSNISSGWGVKVNGSYWNISNMTIRYAPDCGIVFQHGGYNWVYNVTTHGNGDSGLQIYNGSHHNSINNSYSYNNYDAGNGGENADGYACKLSAGAGNQFNYCTATNNSDDGWDLYGQPYSVSIKNCNAYDNGYGVNGDGNGFKLGSAGQNVNHTVTNCWAQNNLAYGYDGNGNNGYINISGSGGNGNGKGLFARIN